MFMRVETISPATATLWLDTKNSRNRPVSQSTVDRYVQEMKTGNWKVNGDAIRFGKDGQLIDGQHRLKACIASNKSFDTVVMRGIENNVFDTVDDGNKRTLADVLAIEGESSPQFLSPAVRFLWIYATGQIETVDLRRGVIATKKVLGGTLAKHPKLRDSVKLFVMLKSRPGGFLIPSGMAIGLHYLFSLVDEVKADEFFTIFQSGLGLREGDPIALLRSRLIQASRDRSSKLTRPAQYFYTVSAWNAFQQGTVIKRLLFMAGEAPIEIENLPKKLMKDLL